MEKKKDDTKLYKVDWQSWYDNRQTTIPGLDTDVQEDKQTNKLIAAKHEYKNLEMENASDEEFNSSEERQEVSRKVSA